MIRSTVANVLVILFGLGLAAVPIIAAIVDRSVSAPSLFFAGLGAWCIAGGVINLKQGAPAIRELRSYRLATWCLALFGASWMALIVGMTGVAKASNSAPFELLLGLSGQGLLASFVLSCGVLLYHRITRAV